MNKTTSEYFKTNNMVIYMKNNDYKNKQKFGNWCNENNIKWTGIDTFEEGDIEVLELYPLDESDNKQTVTHYFCKELELNKSLYLFDTIEELVAMLKDEGCECCLTIRKPGDLFKRTNVRL